MITITHLKSEAIKAAGNRCQGSPEYPDCRAKDGQAHPYTDKVVKLVAFRMIPGDDSSLIVNCQRCFLSRDFLANYRTVDWRKERQAKGNLELFPIDVTGEKS